MRRVGGLPWAAWLSRTSGLSAALFVSGAVAQTPPRMPPVQQGAAAETAGESPGSTSGEAAAVAPPAASTPAPAGGGEAGQPAASEPSASGGAAGSLEPPAAVEQVASQPDAAPPAASASPPAVRMVAPTSTRVQAPVVVELAAGDGHVGFDEGFYVEGGGGEFRAVFGASAQARLSHRRPDDAEERTQMRMPRARLSLHGHLYGERFGYRFEGAFDNGLASLRDAYVDASAVRDWVTVRVGNQRRPLARQQITPGNALAMVDRALTDSVFGAQRDLGVLVHNRYDASPRLEYAAGIFQGGGGLASAAATPVVPSGRIDVDRGEIVEGRAAVAGGAAAAATRNWKPSLMARVGYNHGGVDGYSEADLRGGGLRGAVGLSGQLDLGRQPGSPSPIDSAAETIVVGALDYMLKVDGFASSGAAYLSSVQRGSGFGDRARAAAGLHVQGGYLIAGTYQPAVRYALVDFRTGGDEQVQEIAMGLSVYLADHAIKWQSQWTVLVVGDRAGDRVNHGLDTQLQFGF